MCMSIRKQILWFRKNMKTSRFLLSRACVLISAVVFSVYLIMAVNVHGTVKYYPGIIQQQESANEIVVGSLDQFDAHNSAFFSRFLNVTLTVKGEVMDKNKKLSQTVSHSVSVDGTFLKNIISLLRDQLDVQAAFSSFLAGPIINDHTFSYIHNPHMTCVESRTDILLTVPSAAANFEKRMKVRNGGTGQFTRHAPNNAKLLFFLGRPPQNENYLEVQEKIEAEAERFVDIVQENFEDIYRNMRFKAVSMLKWASIFCPRTKYIIRSDDDININVTQLVSILDRTRQKFGNFILGRLRVHDAPQRVPGKYYLSEKEYPQPTFPPYALGGLLGYPASTVRLLYQAALRLKPIWLDDVFITGMCAGKLGIPVLQDPELKFNHIWQ